MSYSGLIPFQRNNSDAWEMLDQLYWFQKAPEEPGITEYQYGKETRQLEWRANYEFEDALKVINSRRCSSGAIIYLESQSDGTVYKMTLEEFMSHIKEVVHASLSGKFTFYKQGSAYRIIKVKGN
jgi:hypothetical protein